METPALDGPGIDRDRKLVYAVAVTGEENIEKDILQILNYGGVFCTD